MQFYDNWRGVDKELQRRTVYQKNEVEDLESIKEIIEYPRRRERKGSRFLQKRNTTRTYLTTKFQSMETHTYNNKWKEDIYRIFTHLKEQEAKEQLTRRERMQVYWIKE